MDDRVELQGLVPPYQRISGCFSPFNSLGDTATDKGLLSQHHRNIITKLIESRERAVNHGPRRCPLNSSQLPKFRIAANRRDAPQPDSCSATNQLVNHRISAGEQRKGHTEAEHFGVPHFLATQYLRTKGINWNAPGLGDGQNGCL
jgi:hypothetical protein